MHLLLLLYKLTHTTRTTRPNDNYYYHVHRHFRVFFSRDQIALLLLLLLRADSHYSLDW